MVKNKEGVFIMNDYDRQDLIKQRAGLEPSGCLCKECTADPEACTIRRLQKAAKEAV